ncbi:TRAP-type C4-dicarboxylate transport system permease small subunit [Tamaricihabitans halophyticus]|uniref:TRAP-type C4-dicarboxylate transport system permease small subunit n=1 Tax=Tamaricihabitans halophyticus TaxID=1262583 RepID=A0A4R2QT30_9PSEU|nr:TRAP transporter small permease [Tamaricihabitans halophyticus]TCP53072.1 TRAP-type C4-dicarboxylate transport system permease small subunit [Tamaricihabitans halophyticus]
MSTGNSARGPVGRILRALTTASAVLAGAGLVYMALATILAVVLRYVFRQPNRFLFESTEFALALTVFFALGMVALYDRHVRVDLIPRRFARTNRKVDIGARFATAAIAGTFGWFAVQLFVRDLETGIRMGSTFGLPRWILMLALTVGLVLLAANELRGALERLHATGTDAATADVTGSESTGEAKHD